MPIEVIMPKVDMDMATGTIAAWHVAEGAPVEKGAPLFEIETDKAAMEVDAPAAGILAHRLPEGSEVAIGAPVGWLYVEGEAVPDAPPAKAAAPEPAVSNPDTATPDRPRATPAARRLATENAMPLDGIAGSGPHGRIQSADILARLRADAEAPPPAPAMPPVPTPAAAGGPLSVLRSGRDTGMPLVLIHGFAADAGSWTPLERRLRGDRPIYRIELPGHGRSPQRAAASFADLVRDVRGALDALDLDALDLVGHSLGGAVALALADTRPRRIRRLTLIAPAGLGPEIDGAVLAGLARARRAESLAPWLQRLTHDPDALGWSFVQAAALARADDGLVASQTALAEALFPDGTQAFDVSAALDRLAMPTRIVWGRADRVIPWRHALRAPGRVALHLFDRIGHLPHLEAPEAVAELLVP